MWGLNKFDALIMLSLSLSKYFVGFITSMVIPIFPTLIATDFNESLAIGSNLNATVFAQANSTFNYQKLSILFALKTIFQIILCPLFGYLCGILGSTKILLFGTVCQTTTLLLYGLGNKYYVYILGRILESLASCSIHCAVAAFIAYHYKDNKKRGIIYGTSGMGIALGASLGPPFGGPLFQYYGKVVAFLSYLHFNILQIILLMWLLIYFQLEEIIVSRHLKRSQIIEIEPDLILPDISTVVSTSVDVIITTETTNGTSDICNENRKEIEYFIENEERIRTSTDVSLTNANHNILKFFTDPYFMILMGSLFLVFTSVFLYMATVSQYMRLTFGSTESQQGLIWLLNIVGYAVGFFVGNLVNHKFSKNRHIVLMVVIYVQAVASFCMALMPTWWSIAVPLCIVVGQIILFEIVFSPIIAKIVEKRHHKKFGQMSGIIWTAISLVSTVGYLAPILYSKIGFLYLNLIIPLLALVYGPLLLLVKKFALW